MKIQEVCLYNTGVLCGGAGERLGKCWRCGWNPECAYRRKQARLKPKPKKKKKDWHHGAKWRKAMDLYEMGYKDKDIADILHCDYREITRWREHNGLPPQKPRKPRPREYDWVKGMELYKKGLTNIEIANALGCSKSAVKHWLDRSGLKRNFTVCFDWELAKSAYGAGLSDRDIAKILGCTPAAVYQWRLRNNLPKNGVS